VLVVLAVVLARVGRARNRLVATVLAEHADDDPADATARVRDRARAVATRRALADLTDSAGPVLGTVVAVATTVVVVGMCSYLWGGYDLVERAWLSRVTTIGVATIAFAAAGLVALAFWAFRDRRVRRYVGILWDVATFWPRANHPLTPPCYGERAVPDLVRRGRQLTAHDSDRVVLSGHSQGSVLVTATVLQLSADDSHGVALLTYGCPVRRLYGRFFPAYFGPDTVQSALADVDGRWLNLWAPSDPIGSWVLVGAAHPGVDGIDVRLADPTSLVAAADGTWPPLTGHSGYVSRPEFAAATEDLATR
jgi:hypothetical protein